MHRYRTSDKPGHQQKLQKNNSLYVERRRIIKEDSNGATRRSSATHRKNGRPRGVPLFLP
jgi:hypothetical protein